MCTGEMCGVRSVCEPVWGVVWLQLLGGTGGEGWGGTSTTVYSVLYVMSHFKAFLHSTCTDFPVSLRLLDLGLAVDTACGILFRCCEVVESDVHTVILLQWDIRSSFLQVLVNAQ